MKLEETRVAVITALKIGYRHLDSALYYGNEEETGAAIRDAIAQGIVSRQDLFVTGKVEPLATANS